VTCRAPARRLSPAGLAAIGAIALALAACGSAAVSAPIGSAVSSGPSTSPSAAVSGPAASTGGPATMPADTPGPSVDPHEVPDLEALLPATVGGIQMETLSLSGADFYLGGNDQSRPQLDGLLARLGKAIGDVTVADAGDPTGKAVLDVGILRVAGVSSDRLLAEWIASWEASKPGQVTHAAATVGGRTLTQLVDASRPVGGRTYAFAKGDMLFLVEADDLALVSSALAQLPTP
jgi:hypothetical protein